MLSCLLVACKGEDGKDESAIDENPQGRDFYIKDDGTYAVAVGNAKYLSEIVIPATYKGKAVTEIAYNGFSSNSKLKTITISEQQRGNDRERQGVFL